MKTNPLRTHVIGATNCDGTIIDFLKSRETQFKYSLGRGGDYLKLYQLLAQIAIGNPNTKELGELKALADDNMRIHKRAIDDLNEAELCMNTLQHCFTKVDASIQEQIETVKS